MVTKVSGAPGAFKYNPERPVISPQPVGNCLPPSHRVPPAAPPRLLTTGGRTECQR